ncbi:hypothetical protein M7I_0888 [Glarea lozoyensis 74030]|uniref:Uncharacterized protein n=1 Tax=Glarea lozoyensis (strain ATCC 74030 / MF5533) TaxID=1104152 RepID=H0EEK8_GLAL7|nr:hypothetical protein M7I_0888 [Glarea lozoyensis 74030]
MDVTMSGMGQASSQGQQDKSDHSQNGEEQNAGDVPIYYHCAPGSSYFEDEMYMRESDTPPEFLDGAPGPSVTLDPTPSPDASSPPPEPLHDEPSPYSTPRLQPSSARTSRRRTLVLALPHHILNTRRTNTR